MNNNEAVIEVYKKKLETMADLKTDLTDAHDLNQKLQQDIEILTKQQEKVKTYEKQIWKLTEELNQTKDKISGRDLKIQEARFSHQDAEKRAKELSNQNQFLKSQIEQLKVDNAKLSAELNLTNQEKETA